MQSYCSHTGQNTLNIDFFGRVYLQDIINDSSYYTLPITVYKYTYSSKNQKKTTNSEIHRQCCVTKASQINIFNSGCQTVGHKHLTGWGGRR